MSLKDDLKVKVKPRSLSSSKPKSNKKKKGERKKDEIEYFNDTIKEVREIDKSNIKKVKSIKKKALKSIFGYQSMFNIKFLVAWTKTHNFKRWVTTVDKKVAYFSL